MKSFEKAMQFIFAWEGGYVNDPDDPGGETNHGITKKRYPKLDIKNLTKKQAKDIYLNDYWLKTKCHKLKEPLDIIAMDTAVNMGVTRSIKFLQKILRLKDDGVYGPKTREAVMDIDWSGVNLLCMSFLFEREKFYEGIVQRRPKSKKFLQGWLNRVNDLRSFVGLT